MEEHDKKLKGFQHKTVGGKKGTDMEKNLQ